MREQKGLNSPNEAAANRRAKAEGQPSMGWQADDGVAPRPGERQRAREAKRQGRGREPGGKELPKGETASWRGRSKGRLTTACSGGRAARLLWVLVRPFAAPLMRVR